MERSQTLGVLEDLSSRAILEFDELQKNCNKFYTKYYQEHDENHRLHAQFNQLKKASLLAVTEYENVMKRLSDEEKSKEEIVNKLKKIEEENRELRKSQNISPNATIMLTQTSMGASDGATKGELEGLKTLLTGMKEEIRRTKSDVSRLETQLADEKKEHEATQQKLRIGNAQIQQLNRVSVMALDEFQDLRKKYESEVACRRKAEEYASQLLHSQESELRTSRIVNESLPVSDQLDNVLKEIEDLNQTLAKERSQHEQNVKNLQEDLESSKDTQSVKALEGKMSVALDQIELLQSQLQSSEERGRQSELRVQQLSSRLAHAEAALMTGGSMPPDAPPPPPPPPPPLMPAPVIRKFISGLGAKKKKRDKKVPEKDDPIQDMMKEMMARIKDGGLLRPKIQINKEKSPAMNELADLLTNLKRGQSGTEKKEETAEKKETVPEFQQLKLRKVSAKAEPPKVAVKKPMKDSELMKKLDKQRMAAEVEDEENAQSQGNEDHIYSKPRSLSSNNNDIQKEELSTSVKIENEDGKQSSISSPEGIEERLDAKLEPYQAENSQATGEDDTNEALYVNLDSRFLLNAKEKSTAQEDDSVECQKNAAISNQDKESTRSNDAIEESFDALSEQIDGFLDK